MEKLIDGMKVVEVAYYYPGPYCCKILLELGAEVIKIEPPSGDPIRYREDLYAGMNAGKNILRLNLKDNDDRSKFYNIIKNADVIVEGFRVSVAKRLGIDYETLKQINGGLIYCSISGFGQGSEMNIPVHDINILSMAGICEISGITGNLPRDPNVQLADFSSSVVAVISILSAYLRKLKTGKGAYIDVNMFDSSIFAIPLHLLRMANSDSHLPEFYSNPGYGIYKAKDCYVSIGILDEPKFWHILCEKLKLDEYRNISFEERMTRCEEIKNKISKRLIQLNKNEIEMLFGEDLPYGLLKTLKDVVNKSHLIRDEMFDNRIFKTTSFPAKFDLG